MQKPLGLYFALNYYDREAISWVTAAWGIAAILTKDMLVAAIEQHFDQICAVSRPLEFFINNGSRCAAKEVKLVAKSLNIRPVTTPLEGRQSNGVAANFVKNSKKDYIAFLVSLLMQNRDGATARLV